MILFAVIGVVVGAVGFMPLLGSLQLAKRATATSNLGHAGALLLGVLVSFLILAIAAVVCAVAARDFILPFVLGEALALCVVAVAYGVYKLVRK